MFYLHIELLQLRVQYQPFSSQINQEGNKLNPIEKNEKQRRRLRKGKIRIK
jgi:hypothetical protein